MIRKQRFFKYSFETLMDYKAVAFSFFFVCFLTISSNAQIASWNPAGLSAYGPSPWSPTTANANAAYVGLTRAAGIGTGGTAAASAWGGTCSGGAQTTAAGAITANQFVTFSITGNTSYSVSCSTFDLFYRRSGTGAANGDLQYSIGGGSYSTITTLAFTNTTSTGAAVSQVALGGIGALQNVPAGTAVNFRIVLYNNTGAGTWYVFSSGMSIGGTVNLVSGPSAPTVSTTAISNVTMNTATSGGNVSSDGGDPVTARGVCYSTSPNPTLANSFTTDGTGTGAFVSSLSSLTENTLYYVRAYATNSIGTSYGGQQTFTTLKSAPLTQASNIVTLGGGTSMDVSWTNGSGDRRIVVMNSNASFSNPVNGTDPTASAAYAGGEQVVYNGNGNAFTVSGLTPGTNYWLRVFSYNNTGVNTLYNTSTATDNPVMANSGVFTCPTDLLFSEYVEGSSNNKYIEIYNGTASDIDLSKYELRHYNNGSATATYTLPMTGTLASGATIVYRNNSAVIYGGPAISGGQFMSFNGDDALAIWHVPSASFVDIFGTIGHDPGTAWTSASNTTLDRTLRRKATVNAGVTTNPAPGPSFPTLESQWTQFSIDDVSGLGSHTINPCCFVASASSNSPLCSGSDIQLSAPTIAGASYSWTGPNGYTSNMQNPVITNASPLNNGSYEVTVTQTGGCPTTMAAVSVTVNNPPTATINVTNVTCNGGNDGSLTAVPAGGTAPYSYVWDLNNPGGTTFNIIDDIKDATHPYDGIGSSFGFVVNGVQGAALTLTRGVTYTFDINSPGHPVYITTDPDGGSTAGEITNGVTGSQTDFGLMTFKPNGSHPALLYYNCTNHSNMGWQINIVNGPSSPTASSLMAGTYSVLVTDATGCSVSESAVVTEPAPVPAPTITPDTPACGDITLTSSASAAYSWSTGATTQSIIVSADGVYSVSVVNGNGCVSAPTGINVTITPCVPCVTPGSLSTTNVTAVSADFNWDPTVTGDMFSIRYWKDGDALPSGYRYGNVHGPNPATTYNLSGLLPSTLYNVQVKTVCTAGAYSLYSNVQQFSTLNGTIPCIKPFDTRAINITATTATVDWNSVVTADEFRVRYAPAAGGAPYNYSYKTVSGLPNVSSIAVTGLTPGTQYIFSVQSICSGVKSRYSNNEVFTTAVPPSAPVRTADLKPAGISMLVYPNPTTENSTLEINSAINGKYKVNILDVTGRIVGSQNGTVSEGINKIELAVSNLNKGIYLISFDLQDQKVIDRIIIQ